MATESGRQGGDVAAKIARVTGEWHADDPPVLAFPGDGMPVVACVRGDLVLLSYRVVSPQRVTERTVAALARTRGGPHVVSLSEHPAGYEKRVFEP